MARARNYHGFAGALAEYTGVLRHNVRRQRSWGTLMHAPHQRDGIGEHELTATLGLDLLHQQALVVEPNISFNIRRGLAQATGHDTGEVYAVDLATPDGQSNPEAKEAARRLEAKVFAATIAPFERFEVRKILHALYDEEGAQKTAEALTVKFTDRLDAVFYRELVLPPAKFEKGHFEKNVMGPADKIPIASMRKLALEICEQVLEAGTRKRLHANFTYPVDKKELTTADKQMHLFKLMQLLKLTKREGWRIYDVPQDQIDTFAQHSRMVAGLVLAACLQFEAEEKAIKLDTTKCLRLALWGDSYRLGGGDMASVWCLPQDEAQVRSDVQVIWKATSKGIASFFPAGQPAQEYACLMDESVDETSREACFVKIISLLVDYACVYHHVPLNKQHLAHSRLAGGMHARVHALQRMGHEGDAHYLQTFIRSFMDAINDLREDEYGEYRKYDEQVLKASR